LAERSQKTQQFQRVEIDGHLTTIARDRVAARSHHFEQGGRQNPIIKWGLRNFGRTNPIRLGMAARPPEFGEQTEEVLAEFGFGADEVAKLRQAKVV
jgi:hypothetical protein